MPLADNWPIIHTWYENGVSRGHCRSLETLPSRFIAPTRLPMTTVPPARFREFLRPPTHTTQYEFVIEVDGSPEAAGQHDHLQIAQVASPMGPRCRIRLS
jgi:hypothetical protein